MSRGDAAADPFRRRGEEEEEEDWPPLSSPVSLSSSSSVSLTDPTPVASSGVSSSSSHDWSGANFGGSNINEAQLESFSLPCGFGSRGLCAEIDKERERELFVGRDSLFNKRYSFPRKTASEKATTTLLEDALAKSFSVEYEWKDEVLQQLKYQLNTVRSKLDEKDIQFWHKHTSFTNLAGDVVFQVRRNIQPEVCTIAWCKLYELLHGYDLLPWRDNTQDRPVSTIHLCEAPGAFVAATNHFLRQTYGQWLNWYWKAMTLNPYYESNDIGAMIDNDRFLLETYDHWFFGLDNSGNIFSKDSVRELWRLVQEEQGPVELVTCDGSIDCSGAPEDQELMVASLHFMEAICAIGLLAVGGNLVLKLFNIFESQTVCLLFLLWDLFEELHLSKPATSKSGNSEIYLVAKGFQGASPELLEILLSHANTTTQRILFSKEALPPILLQSVRDASKQFTNWQIETIERNLNLEGKRSRADDRAIRAEKQAVAEEFIHRFQLISIPEDFKLVPNTNLLENQLSTGGIEPGYRSLSGTLADRRNRKRTHEELIYKDTTTSSAAKSPSSTEVSEHTHQKRKLSEDSRDLCMFLLSCSRARNH